MTILPVVKTAVLFVIWHLPPATPFEPTLPSWWNGGRVYTAPDLHVGVRPALDWGNGVGFTVQVTVRTPW